ncbi:MAG: 4Fe-4S cluster-binding domain-containing protein, partial [Thermoproteota archaeon]
MQVDTLENALFATMVNPMLRRLISFFDIECPKDGSLLLNTLKDFLGEPIPLCSMCQHISRHVAKPFYEIGSRLLKVNKNFMKKQFIKGKYGEAWFKGFGLMMKGIEKYGIRIPFVPASPFEVVWNFTYKCNLRCKHCYEDAGSGTLLELSIDEAKQVNDVLSKIAGVGLPALSFSGGEPLARKDFFEVASYAKKHIPYI